MPLTHVQDDIKVVPLVLQYDVKLVVFVIRMTLDYVDGSFKKSLNLLYKHSCHQIIIP